MAPRSNSHSNVTNTRLVTPVMQNRSHGESLLGNALVAANRSFLELLRVKSLLDEDLKAHSEGGSDPESLRHLAAKFDPQLSHVVAAMVDRLLSVIPDLADSAISSSAKLYVLADHVQREGSAFRTSAHWRGEVVNPEGEGLSFITCASGPFRLAARQLFSMQLRDLGSKIQDATSDTNPDAGAEVLASAWQMANTWRNAAYGESSPATLARTLSIVGLLTSSMSTRKSPSSAMTLRQLTTQLDCDALLLSTTRVVSRHYGHMVVSAFTTADSSPHMRTTKGHHFLAGTPGTVSAHTHLPPLSMGVDASECDEDPEPIVADLATWLIKEATDIQHGRPSSILKLLNAGTVLNVHTTRKQSMVLPIAYLDDLLFGNTYRHRGVRLTPSREYSGCVKHQLESEVIMLSESGFTHSADEAGISFTSTKPSTTIVTCFAVNDGYLSTHAIWDMSSETNSARIAIMAKEDVIKSILND